MNSPGHDEGQLDVAARGRAQLTAELAAALRAETVAAGRRQAGRGDQRR